MTKSTHKKEDATHEPGLILSRLPCQTSICALVLHASSYGDKVYILAHLNCAQHIIFRLCVRNQIFSIFIWSQHSKQVRFRCQWMYIKYYIEMYRILLYNEMLQTVFVLMFYDINVYFSRFWFASSIILLLLYSTRSKILSFHMKHAYLNQFTWFIFDEE